MKQKSDELEDPGSSHWLIGKVSTYRDASYKSRAPIPST